MMVNMHEQLKTELADKTGKSRFSVSGRALGIGSERFKRIVFRGLDYLPPGEISFADYGRAIIAADQASHPDAPAEREWIKDEFVRRHMALSREALEVDTNYRCPELDDVDLDALVESDWVAYDFANRYRALLRIPEGVPFQVRPRLVASKRYYHKEGAKTVQECLLKVAWDVPEPNAVGRRFPSQRQITVGTTLAIDWLTRKVRALLTSDQAQRPEEARIQREDRNAMLRYMLDHDVLEVGAYALGPHGRPRRSVVRAEAARGTLRVRGAARLLEIAVAQ
jgi:hypothetical protein